MLGNDNIKIQRETRNKKIILYNIIISVRMYNPVNSFSPILDSLESKHITQKRKEKFKSHLDLNSVVQLAVRPFSHLQRVTFFGI